MNVGGRNIKPKGERQCPKCGKPVKRGFQKYCSRECAPLSHIPNRVTAPKLSRSEWRTDESDGTGASGYYRQFLDRSSKTENEIKKDTTPIPASTTGEDMRTKNETLIEKVNGTTGDESTIRNSGPKRDLEESNETPSTDLTTPLISSEGAKYLHLNLIDSTAKHLHGLMKSIAVDHPEIRNSPQMVNAACNCAKNMRELLRLKLDVVKESKEWAQ